MARLGVMRGDPDQGSVLPLVLGLVALLMMVLGGLTSLAEITREQRWLHQLGDQAVVAATTALDMERYYREGAVAEVPLDPELARRRAMTTLADAPVRVESFAVIGDVVHLTLTREVDLIWGVGRLISVSVSAKALNPSR